MADRYVVISDKFAAEMEGKVSGNVEFNARKTIRGLWVCAEQSVVDFAEEFKNMEPIETVELAIADFPTEQIQINGGL